jgi:uncharacterized protein involved in exopolysaccharide biosynthesis
MQAEKGLPRPDPEADAGDLFDYATLRDYLRFAAASIRRHLLLVTFLLCSVIGLAVVYLNTFPKTYRVETRMFAQRNQVMASLGNPGRAMPGEFDAPTRAASETIMNHTNLVSLIQQTNLLQRWEETRPPIARFMTWILAHLKRPSATDEDRIDAMVYLLERKLVVTTGDGTIDITLDWNNPQVAYRVVEAAQQNFLEARHASEISPIAEAISILEGHAALTRDEIEASTEDLQRAVEARAGKPEPPRPARSPQSGELAQIRVLILEKRAALAEREDFRRKRLAELQAQLGQDRAVYAEQHPIVVERMQNIEAALKGSPQITALREEEREWVRKYKEKGGKERDLDRVASGREGAPVEAHRALKRSEGDDSALSPLRNRLQSALQNYNALGDRIYNARIELDTHRAAFKYRYSVIRPPQLPKSPIKPKMAVVIAISIVGGLLLGLFTAILLDVSSEVILTRWQVERQLGLPVLTVVNKP